jgi:hypothetical protein
MPHVRDHNPRYCSTCQFWLTFSKVFGAISGVLTAAILILAVFLVLGGLGLAGFFTIGYFEDHTDKFRSLATFSLGVLLFSACMGLGLAVKDRFSDWLSERKHRNSQVSRN